LVSVFGNSVFEKCGKPASNEGPELNKINN